MTETPYWLAVDSPETPPLPWSGEVIPIDVPTVPVDIPVAGPVIHFIGAGEHAVWHDVWNWVKGEASSAASSLQNIEQTVANAVTKTIEGYVGSLLQATSSFVNDLADYTYLGIDSLANVAVDTWDHFQTAIDYADAVIYGLLTDVNAIDTIEIPALLGDIGRVAIDTEEAIAGTVDELKVWAIDNIYGPLDALIQQVEVTIPVWAEGALSDAKAYADDLVHSEALQRAAAIAGIAAAVSALVAESETCTQPMCDTMGPNTDLGKLLKGLQAVLAAGALSELTNARESDIADAIRRIGAKGLDVFYTLDRDFIQGGDTLAQTVADELKNLI